ncbi:hypothetical protein H696_04273 [Fonticula alba]|uniref:Conserved oligomeric Golgi complex subunit 3 n=1 Tax=Fonticula alba TaxID=691883 RepID=A0A058Z3L4_FONAL|nr:hypothetical protein H696_04273 [Fonticula alba]KCV68855.1 hypothetical protein H696_04273 [Fonticula alba]|eukprot:XP_009496426.1 hypothetical protein H696_04273 [Fonticula alba]
MASTSTGPAAVATPSGYRTPDPASSAAITAASSNVADAARLVRSWETGPPPPTDSQKLLMQRLQAMVSRAGPPDGSLRLVVSAPVEREFLSGLPEDPAGQHPAPAASASEGDQPPAPAATPTGGVSSPARLAASVRSSEALLAQSRVSTHIAYGDSLLMHASACDTILEHATEALDALFSLDSTSQEVRTRTRALQDSCDALATKRAWLEKFATALDQRLDVFAQLDVIAAALARPLAEGDDLQHELALIERAEASAAFFESRPFYLNSSVYVRRAHGLTRQALGRLRERAVLLISTARREALDRVYRKVTSNPPAGGASDAPHGDPVTEVEIERATLCDAPYRSVAPAARALLAFLAQRSTPERQAMEATRSLVRHDFPATTQTDSTALIVHKAGPSAPGALMGAGPAASAAAAAAAARGVSARAELAQTAAETLGHLVACRDSLLAGRRTVLESYGGISRCLGELAKPSKATVMGGGELWDDWLASDIQWPGHAGFASGGGPGSEAPVRDDGSLASFAYRACHFLLGVLADEVLLCSGFFTDGTSPSAGSEPTTPAESPASAPALSPQLTVDDIDALSNHLAILGKPFQEHIRAKAISESRIDRLCAVSAGLSPLLDDLDEPESIGDSLNTLPHRAVSPALADIRTRIAFRSQQASSRALLYPPPVLGSPAAAEALVRRICAQSPAIGSDASRSLVGRPPATSASEASLQPGNDERAFLIEFRTECGIPLSPVWGDPALPAASTLYAPLRVVIDLVYLLHQGRVGRDLFHSLAVELVASMRGAVHQASLALLNAKTPTCDIDAPLFYVRHLACIRQLVVVHFDMQPVAGLDVPVATTSPFLAPQPGTPGPSGQESSSAAPAASSPGRGGLLAGASGYAAGMLGGFMQRGIQVLTDTLPPVTGHLQNSGPFSRFAEVPINLAAAAAAAQSILSPALGMPGGRPATAAAVLPGVASVAGAAGMDADLRTALAAWRTAVATRTLAPLAATGPSASEVDDGLRGALARAAALLPEHLLRLHQFLLGIADGADVDADPEDLDGALHGEGGTGPGLGPAFCHSGRPG